MSLKQSIKGIAIVSVLLAGTAFANADEAADLKRIFGFEHHQNLIIGIEKACPFVREQMQSAPRSDLTLLMTDEGANGFHAGACDGECTLEETQRLLSACMAETGLGFCWPFAALNEGRLFDLSIDPTGAKLADCAS